MSWLEFYSALCVGHRTETAVGFLHLLHWKSGVNAMQQSPYHADQQDIIIRYQRQRALLLGEIKESQELIERCQEVVRQLDELLSGTGQTSSLDKA